MTYTPERWVFVNVRGERPLRKVFAGWYGGYLGADEWRISSQVEQLEERDDVLVVTTRSGATYHLVKDRNGVSVFMLSVLENLRHELAKVGGSIEMEYPEA